MGKRNRYGLTDRDMKTIRSILRSYPEIHSVHLFGSRAKGNHRLGSDVDLAIMNNGVSDKIIAKLRDQFKESTLPYRIDLVDFNQLENKEFIEHIEQFGVPFYTADEEEIIV
ncbi:MAG: nucleotidyltransferase domain-containing protein [Bacteroidetes bacterium]|jgi:predicted nucleotidyltransferase|nr:nucleotidyltransferase domain-containing protein [Bacteroidota bacterium]